MNDSSINNSSMNELPDDINLLKTVLPALLEDFQHWFGRTVERLESSQASFLTPEQQQGLLARVRAAKQQVSAAQVLSAATDSQAGIEMSVVMGWHKLVHECWGVALRMRREESAHTQASTEISTETGSTGSLDVGTSDSITSDSITSSNSSTSSDTNSSSSSRLDSTDSDLNQSDSVVPDSNTTE